MSLLGFIGKVATGFVTGGPLGAATAVASQVLPGIGASSPVIKSGGGISVPLKSQPQLVPQTPSVFSSPLPSPDSIKVTASGTNIAGIYQSGQLTGTAYYPSSDPFANVQSGSSSTAMTVCGAPRGYRLNKTGYFLRNGQYVAPGTKCVKSRRRNPLNPRALSRAMGRLASAKKAAKALDRFEVKGRRCR